MNAHFGLLRLKLLCSHVTMPVSRTDFGLYKQKTWPHFKLNFSQPLEFGIDYKITTPLLQRCANRLIIDHGGKKNNNCGFCTAEII